LSSTPDAAPRRGPGTGPWLASLGAGLEYYDFVVYALLAPALRDAFFPSHGTHLSSLEAFGLFTVGYVARPLGGVVFGSRGDRKGRKATFLHTTVLMAAATFAMGCLPTYAQAGLLAPAALVLLRFVQGLSFGGELPGAITFVAEHAGRRGTGAAAGVVMSGVTLGSLLAALLLNVLSRVGEVSLGAWAWRIPFWCGGSLAAVAFAARLKMQETPVFSPSGAKPSGPVVTLLTRYPLALACGLGVTLLGASLVVFPLYAPVFLTTTYGYPRDDVYTATTVSLVLATFATVACGRLADRCGPHRLLALTGVAWALAVPGVFSLLSRGTFAALLSFALLWQVATSLTVGSYMPILAGLFPTPVRYTGVACCYNGAFMLAGAAPMLFAALTAGAAGAGGIPWIYGGVAGLAAAAAGIAARLSAPARPGDETSPGPPGPA
jgi:predicted MFS family arabinose efflux permease